MRRHYPPRYVLMAITALWGGLFVATGPVTAGEQQSLIGKDLSTWQGDTGHWAIVQEAKIDPANHRRLVTTAGTGTWKSWQLPTGDNPYILPEEIEAARESMPELIFEQEYLANFGGKYFEDGT